MTKNYIGENPDSFDAKKKGIDAKAEALINSMLTTISNFCSLSIENVKITATIDRTSYSFEMTKEYAE
jgi:hypothetical protein